MIYEVIAFGVVIGLLGLAAVVLVCFALPALKREKKARLEAERLCQEYTRIRPITELLDDSLYVFVGKVQSTSLKYADVYVVEDYSMSRYYIVRSAAPLPARFRKSGDVIRYAEH